MRRALRVIPRRLTFNNAPPDELLLSVNGQPPSEANRRAVNGICGTKSLRAGGEGGGGLIYLNGAIGEEGGLTFLVGDENFFGRKKVHPVKHITWGGGGGQ